MQVKNHISMNKNTWILGGTGYIGSALLKSLLAHQPPGRLHALLHKSLPLQRLERVNTFVGSLGKIDPEWLKHYPPDVVFHLARPAGSHRISREWASRQGEAANRSLVRQLTLLERPPVVVYVSGSLVYGPRHDDDPATEKSPLAPAAFARHYHRNERPWLEARESGILDVRFARPGWITGPASWFRQFFWLPMQSSGWVPCYGDGKQLMSLIHLDEGVRMIRALADRGGRNQDLNIFSGKPLSQSRFCTILSSITGLPVEQVADARVKKTYGRTALAALTTSIPMQTLYPELQARALPVSRDHKALLADIVRLLEDKEAVLSP